MRHLSVVPDEWPEERDEVGEANQARKDRLVQNIEQVGDAEGVLELQGDAFLRLPYPTLNAVVGGLAPSDIWFVAAFSGRGKTTLLTSIVDEYIAAGRTVYLMGLESQPKEIRTHLACRHLTRQWYASHGREGAAVDGGDVLSGALHDTHGWLELRKKLKAAIAEQ